MLTVYVDSALRLKHRKLSTAVHDQIRAALVYPNPEREAAEREGLHGWAGMPEYLQLYSYVPHDIMEIPRGFAVRLKNILDEAGIEWRWDLSGLVDKQMALNITFRPIKLRPYQVPAVHNIVNVRQGIYAAPPGSGKTVSVLAAIAEVKRRALIIVDKTNLAAQWKVRVAQHLGMEAGIVGDGEWEDTRSITVALHQSLWSRRTELKDLGWYDQFGFVCLDECHHIPASTIAHTMSKFPAAWRIGVSATPDRDNGSFPVALAVLGEVFHQTHDSELESAGVMVRPTVTVIPTKFSFPFHPTTLVGADDVCRIAGCQQVKAHRHANNYQQLSTALQDDDERNNRIVEEIMKRRGKCQLVISRRLKHLDTLLLLCEKRAPTMCCMFLTGRETSDERMRAAAIAEDGDCVIFSTIADEALDIPRLDTVHLTWPTRNSKIIEQQVGRIKRVHPDKTTAEVIDYHDSAVGILRGQFKNRRKYYTGAGMMVDIT